MSDFSAIFSELIFNVCGLTKDDSDLAFRLSEDIGNIYDLASNKIYINIAESYPLISEYNEVFALSCKFSDDEVEFQKSISKDGELTLDVHATSSSEQIWSIEASIPIALNNPNAKRKILTVMRIQQMLEPYEVTYQTDYEESLSTEDFEKIALAYTLKY